MRRASIQLHKGHWWVLFIEQDFFGDESNFRDPVRCNSKEAATKVATTAADEGEIDQIDIFDKDGNWEETTCRTRPTINCNGGNNA